MQTADSAQPQPNTIRNKRIFDALVIFGFFCFSLFAEIGILQAGHYPYIALSGDGANITSYSAGWDHPELFKGDELLGDLHNISFYATIHIPMTRFLAKFVGSYSVAFVLPLGITAFVQLLGFYVLGLVLFRNRYWALLLSIITLLWAPMNLGEFWGFYTEPLPRFTFEALLPFILAAAIAWKDKPRRWIWIMVMAGAMMYIHPVSAPVWGASLWLGFIACKPADWSWRRFAGYMILLGIVFVLICVPFALNFVGSSQSNISPDYNTVFNIMSATLPIGSLNIPIAVRDFAISMAGQILPVVGVLAAFALFRLLKGQRRDLYIMLWWIVGIVLVAVALPLVDHTVSRMLKHVPFETDLIPGLRYLIPLSLLFCLWALVKLAKVATQPRMKRVFQVVGIVALAFWTVTHYQQIYVVRNGFNCLRQFKLICSSPTPDSELMDAIKTKTPPDSQMVLTSGDYQWLSVRYYSLRPLVYIWRDGGGLFYANEIQLTQWVKLRDRLDVINTEQDLTTRLKDLVEFTRQQKAQYLVTDFQADDIVAKTPQAELIYSNSRGSLIAIH